VAIKLFGFEINRKKSEQEDERNKTFALPQSDDGAVTIQSGAYYGTYVDLDGVVRNEIELITRYREMAMQPEIEGAIDDIVNEAIVNEDRGNGVEINTDELKQSDQIKKKIREEFEYILKLLNFGNMGHDIFRRWYVDGRMFYHVIIDDKSPQKGIQELRYIDPRRIRKIREIQKTKDTNTGMEIIKRMNEYYLYNERGVIGAHSNLGTKIAIDSVVNINSGLMDSKRAMVLSYLHKAIKPLNQLRMVEDATVIYRLSRAPERRVFYVDVGNMPTIKAEQYLRDIMVKYRNKLVYDSSTGEIKDDRKHLCLSMDTKVPLLDGRTLTLTEISEEYKTKQLWAYSADPETGKFAPGLITWAGVSRPNAEVMRLTFDNGKSVTCTPDHRFPLWNKGLVAAQDLQVGDSVIPLYRKTENITPGAKKNKDYEQIWENDKKTWAFTHRTVSIWKDKVELENEFVFNEDFIEKPKDCVHHKNINRFDNSPENLVRMNTIDHILYHRSSGSGSGKFGGRNCYEMGVGVHNKQHPDYRDWHVKAGKIGGKVSGMKGKSQENYAKGREVLSNLLKDSNFREFFIQRQREGWTEEKKNIASAHAKRNRLSERGNAKIKELWKNEDYAKRKKKKYTVEYTQEIFDFVKECAEKQLSKAETVKKLNESVVLLSTWKKINADKHISKKQKSFDKFIEDDVYKVVKQYTSNSYAQLKEQTRYRNHKIVKIEYLDERMDTGCLTIDGDEIYHSYHTFGLDAGIYTQNSMLEDFWLPRREGGKGTEITTLPGGQNLGELEDVKYFEKKLYKALGVPISRLEPAQGFSLGRTSEVTRDELKFNKFVERLRNKFSILFDDLLRVQLVLKKVCSEEEWKEFKENIYYDFIKDNNFTELKEAELLLNRMGVLQMVDPYVGRYYSKEWVRRNVLMMKDDEIEEIDEQIAQEQAENVPTDEQGNPIPDQQQVAAPNIVPPTPIENMLQQQLAQQGASPEQMPVQDGTGKDTMDPLEMGQTRSARRFVNDTMEPVR